VNKDEQKLHLERDIQVAKVTFCRWLAELTSLPGGPEKWVLQERLLKKKTHWYTYPEIRALLLLGKTRYQGRSDTTDTRLSQRCRLYVIHLRQKTVARAESALLHHENERERKHTRSKVG
jgi:hypothetical protein